MRKIFTNKILPVIIGILGLSHIANAQFTYDFGTNSEVQATTGSTLVNTTMFPAPPSGTSYARTGSGTGSIAAANPGESIGTGSELRIDGPSGGSPIKFGLPKFSGGYTFYAKFNTMLPGSNTTNATYVFNAGLDSATNIYSSGGSSYSGAYTVTSLAFVHIAGGSSVNVTYRNSSGSSVPLTTLQKNTPYTIEVYANNSTSSTTYSRCGTTYNLASSTQDVWINNAIMGTGISTGPQTVGKRIDGLMFYGANTITTASGAFVVDDLTYGPSLPMYTKPSGTTTVTNISCFGAANGAIDLSVSNGTAPYSYAWSNTATTQDLTSLAPGTYSVTIADAMGCTATSSATVSQPSALMADIIGSGDEICQNSGSGYATVSASGGTSGYTYLWSPSNSTSATATGLKYGQHIVTITDAKGCVAKDTVVISYTMPQPVITGTVTNPTCVGSTNGSIDLQISGGSAPYSQTWTPSLDSTTALGAGSYSVEVTDNNGCTNSKLFTLVNPASITSFLIYDNITCYGDDNGYIETAPTGNSPFTFSWNTGDTAQSIYGLAPGNYSVTISDANGCTKVENVTITEPPIISTTLPNVVDVTCAGAANGSIALPVSGGTKPYSFTWSTNSTDSMITGLSGGFYNLDFVDANGCGFEMDSIPVIEPDSLMLSAVASNIQCNGGLGSIDLTVTGGTGSYAYLWADTVLTQDRTGLSAGSYSVVVTDDNGCTASTSATISEPSAISLTITKTNVSCHGLSDGSANLTVSGGTSPYSYSWSNNETTEDIAGLDTGMYTVIVTDGNNCTNSTSISVTQPPMPVVPTNLRTVDIQDVSAEARWNAVPGATSYRLRLRVKGTTTWGPIILTGQLYRKFTGLDPNKTYEWSIRAVCGSTVGSWFSSNVEFKTLALPCQAPSSPTLLGLSDTEATLSWTAPASGSTPNHYRVIIRKSGDAWPSTPSYTPTSNSVVATNLDPGTTYEWKVRTVCNSAGTASSAFIAGGFFTTISLKTLSIEDAASEISLKSYPNPATTSLTIELNSTFEGTITITDLQGKSVVSQVVDAQSGSKLNLDVAHLSNGMYLIQVQSAKGVITEKIQIQR